MSSSSSALRYVLVRNLPIPQFDARSSGVFVQINHHYSEVHWGSKEAIWLIGEGAVALPMTIRIYLVTAPQASFASRGELELVSNFLTSSLAHPNRKLGEEGGAVPSYENTKLVYEIHVDLGLVPLRGVTLHDLTPLPSSGAVLLFAGDSGKLFANRGEENAMLRSFFPNPLPPPMVSPPPRQQPPAAGYSHLAWFPQMLECCDRIVSTRQLCEQVQRDIQVQLDLLDVAQVERRLQRERKAKAKQAKQAQLWLQMEQLRVEIAALRGEEEDEDEEEQEEPVCVPNELTTGPLRMSVRLLNVRSLELLRHALEVYPLQGTCIRGVDLLAGKEDERSLALGHLAHLARFLSLVFDVPLRFTPVAFGSKSFVLDPLLFAHHSLSRVLRLFDIADNAGGLFPLFPGKVRWKFESGVQLLFVGLHQLVTDLGARFDVPIAVQKPSTLQSFHNLKILFISLGAKIDM